MNDERKRKQKVPKDLWEKDWMLEMLKQFDHPSTALWRAVEARCICALLSKIVLKNPILDLGCGEGKFSSTIFSRGRVDIGLDISKDDVSKAKKSTTYKGVIVGDARALPFRNESFNVVFSNSVVEHILGIDKVLAETSRVLKKDGMFIFTVPSNQFGNYLFLRMFLQKVGLKKLACWYSKKRNELLNHYNCYDVATWRHKIEDVGLNVVEFKYYLSKSTIRVWDFLAICIFLVRMLSIFKPRFTVLLLAKTKKIRTSIFKRILYKYYYDQNCGIGGGLLIAAKKTQDARKK